MTLKRFAPYLFVATLFTMLAIPLVVTQRRLSWASVDELGCHYVTIRQFQGQWPHLDLRDYPSPETPLYHVTLAAISQLNDNIITLRLASFAMSLAALLVIEAYLLRRAQSTMAVFFTMLVAVSPYFLGAAVRLLTDNLGLGAAVAALFALDDAFDLSVCRSATGALFGTVAVLTRQVYLWTAPVQFVATFTHRQVSHSQRLVNAALSTVPALALASFVLLWHGFTPISWIGWSNNAALSVNVNVPIFILSLLGVLGTVFIFTMCRVWRSGECRLIYAILLATIGMLILVVHPFTIDEGGWLLAVGRSMPKLLGTRLPFWILLPLGLVYLYILLARQLMSGSYLVIIAWVLWMLMNGVSGRIFQRYYEPMLLVFVAYVLTPWDFKSRKEWLMPCVYLVGCLGQDVMIFYWSH